ncbi:MAG: hypothetical protein ACR2PM_09310, partial [Hyphomicrobiales bacterium]
GVAGIGPYEYLELLRRFGLPLGPKVVVMNIYEGNDLRDVLKHVKHAVSPGKSKIRGDSGPFAVSYALAFLKGAIEVTVKRFRKASSSAIPFGYTVQSEGAAVAMNPGNTDTDEVKHARKVLAGDVRFDVFAPPIRAFADLAAEKGFAPVVTYIPSAYSAYRASVKFADETVGREVLEFSAAQRRWLAENAGQFGVHFIDMTPAFERAAASGPLTHFPANVHLTPAGHKVVEAALAPHLKALLAGRQE